MDYRKYWELAIDYQQYQVDFESKKQNAAELQYGEYIALNHHRSERIEKRLIIDRPYWFKSVTTRWNLEWPRHWKFKYWKIQPKKGLGKHEARGFAKDEIIDVQIKLKNRKTIGYQVKVLDIE